MPKNLAKFNYAYRYFEIKLKLITVLGITKKNIKFLLKFECFIAMGPAKNALFL